MFYTENYNDVMIVIIYKVTLWPSCRTECMYVTNTRNTNIGDQNKHE